MIKNALKNIGETVVRPVVDELAKSVEQGAQSIAGTGQYQQQPPQKQQEEAQKKQEEERKKRNIMQFIQQMQADEQRLKQQRAQEMQAKQQEKQEEVQEKKVDQLEVSKRDQDIAVAQRQRRVELRKGGS